jgi:hypothetical protein
MKTCWRTIRKWPNSEKKKRMHLFFFRPINGLNGFLLLMHMGTDPVRTDKFYLFLESLIAALKSIGTMNLLF